MAVFGTGGSYKMAGVKFLQNESFFATRVCVMPASWKLDQVLDYFLLKLIMTWIYADGNLSGNTRRSQGMDSILLNYSPYDTCAWGYDDSFVAA